MHAAGPHRPAVTTPPELPALPPWPTNNLTIIGAHQWAVLGQTLAQLHADHRALVGQVAALAAELQTLSSVLTRPVSGRVFVSLKETRPMPIPVHPPDALAFPVQYDNAAHQAVA